MIIEFEEFTKLDIRVGQVISCEIVSKTKNLYKLLVDCGEENYRQIITGISKFYEPVELINRKIVVLTNLKPKVIMGLVSNGMLLAADFKGEPFLLEINERSGKKIPPGSKIK
jgi:methionyl-tRNA synthetase